MMSLALWGRLNRFMIDKKNSTVFTEVTIAGDDDMFAAHKQSAHPVEWAL